tara:strand:+ start:79 stop:297 length:219 start_codon:yes stop_codon:yes gene_type:complete
VWKVLICHFLGDETPKGRKYMPKINLTVQLKVTEPKPEPKPNVPTVKDGKLTFSTGYRLVEKDGRLVREYYA